MQIAIDLPWGRAKTPQIEVPNVELPQVDVAAKVEDTKRALSDGADTIGTVAHDLGNQAANLGREAIKIGKDAAKMSRSAARRGQLLAATSGDTLRQLRSDAAATVDDLRSIRIVREKRQGTDLRPGLALLAGATAGIAAMYFLDPEQGRRRRVLLMDQLRKFSRRTGEWFDGTARDLRNRSQGWATEARKATDSIGSTQQPEFESNGVMDSPDVSNELSATDWAETESSEPVRG